MSHPYRGNAEDKSREIIAWVVFESYAKTVIRNKSRSLKRNGARAALRQTYTKDQLSPHNYYDNYPSDVLYVHANGMMYGVHNLVVYESLMSLAEERREPLILHFWAEWTDDDLALHYEVSSRTIRKWRHQALVDLRGYISGGCSVAKTDKCRRRRKGVASGDRR